MVVIYAVVSVVASATRPLWNDELFTLHVADQPSLHLLFSVLRTGAEANPPGFHLLTRAVIKAFGTGQVALRVPALVASLLLLPMLYYIVSRRLGTAAGYLAALVPLATVAPSYSYEARPYALVLALAALVLLSWQAYIDGRRPRLALTGLAFGGAAATCMHYYGPLILLPIAVGELIRSRQLSRIDYRVWVCLLVAVLPLLAFIPFIRAGIDLTGVPWDPVRSSQAVSSYLWLLPVTMIVLFTSVALAVTVVGRRRRRRHQVLSLPLPAPEMAAAATFLLVPAAAVAIGEFATGAFTQRYGLAAVIGVAVLLPAGARFLEPSRGRLTAALCIVVGLISIEVAVSDQVSVASQRKGQDQTLALLAHIPPGAPVIVAEPHAFLDLSHAAPPAVARSLLYIADPAQATAKTGSNIEELELMGIAPFADVKVRKYPDLITRQRKLVVLVADHDPEWLVPVLRADGYAITEIRRDGVSLLLSATLGSRSRIAVR